MACEQNILDRHRSGLPFLTSTAKAGNTLLAASLLTHSGGDHVRDRFSMPGDHNGLTMLDPPQEFC